MPPKRQLNHLDPSATTTPTGWHEGEQKRRSNAERQQQLAAIKDRLVDPPTAEQIAIAEIIEMRLKELDDLRGLAERYGLEWTGSDSNGCATFQWRGGYANKRITVLEMKAIAFSPLDTNALLTKATKK